MEVEEGVGGRGGDVQSSATESPPKKKKNGGKTARHFFFWDELKKALRKNTRTGTEAPWTGSASSVSQ